MLRKTTLIYFVASVLTLLTGIVLSCTPSGEVSICDIQFGVWGSPKKDTAILDGKLLGFSVGSYDEALCCNRPRYPLISSCYAFKKCFKWKNGLVISSFNLSFDKKIVLDGDTLQPGTNILTQPSFVRYAEFKAVKSCNYKLYETVVNDTSVLQTMVFDTGVYTAKFSCDATDDKHFDKQQFVIFRK